MINVIIYFITSIIIIFFIIIKLCFRFWSSQPVFHSYNPFHWLYSSKIINREKPKKTKFFDYSITTIPYHEISTEKKALILYFLQSHYFQPLFKRIFNKNTYYSCFELQNKNAFISLFQNGINNQIIGYISSRLLCGYINKKKMFISFLDDWTIRKKYDIINNKYKLLYSHYYNVRNINSSKIFLFESDKITSVIPYCKLDNALFNINKWIRINKNLPVNITCKLINDQSFPLLTDIFKNVQNKFNTYIIPSYSNIKNLIKNGLIYPCVLIDKTTPIAVVFYRNNFQKYDKKSMINMVCSYCREGYENILKNSLTNMLYILNYKFKFSYLNINNSSDNGLLMDYMKYLDIPKLTTKSYYYFYNYISRPIKSSKLFLLK